MCLYAMLYILGDPNDRTLRNVEKEIVIPKMMKERALKLCDVEVKGDWT